MEIDAAQKQILVFDAVKREIIRGLFILLLIVITFLFFRLILKIFGANPDTFFVGLVYIISGIFLLPFFGIFPAMQDKAIAGKPVADGVAFIGLFSYLILIPLIMGITHLVTGMLKTTKKGNETIETSQPISEDKELVKKVVE